MAGPKDRKRAFKGRKSKVDAVAHLVGKVPDRELAEQIGVTPENVRTWRKRRGIEPTWKTDEAAPAPMPRRSPKRGKKPRRRKSKLDPYRAELGTVPDRVVAEKAGVTAENVRTYRKRHGIESSWRQASEAPAKPAPAAKPAAKPARQRRSGPTPPPRGWAFRVTAEIDGAEREYVTFGADVVEAATVARDRLARGGNARIKKIEVVGVAL